MRLGDLDALSAFVGDLRRILHKEQSTFKAMTQSEFEIKDNMYLNFQYAIDNAPTVEPFEPDYVGAERLEARQRGYEEGYHNGMVIGKTLNPKIKQGEWITVHYAREELNCPEKSMLDFVKCPFCETIHQGRHNFCSRCGADMKGGAE